MSINFSEHWTFEAIGKSKDEVTKRYIREFGGQVKEEHSDWTFIEPGFELEHSAFEVYVVRLFSDYPGELPLGLKFGQSAKTSRDRLGHPTQIGEETIDGKSYISDSYQYGDVTIYITFQDDSLDKVGLVKRKASNIPQTFWGKVWFTLRLMFWPK